VKFLCDRCKTRYSIGEDRVRGKILKIRCKNCANVITVREGMSLDAEAAPSEADGGTRAPLAGAAEARPVREAPEAAGAPAEAASRAAPRPASAAASRGGARDPLASLSTKRSAEIETVRGLGRSTRAGAPARSDGRAAPAALEEEWYVSVDGEQAGPFSLAAAQRWVTQQSGDAELHCWSEGFDDWLPVDKVSHFRGLRKRPSTSSAPPPVPRTAAGAPRPVAGEDEPKPLFAATMASLERDAAAMPAGLGLPPATAPAARATSVRETPTAARGEPIRPTNGAPGPATPLGPRAEARSDARDARPSGRLDPASAARPSGRLDPASAARPSARPEPAAGPPAGKLDPGQGGPDRPALGEPFDLSEGSGGEPDGTDGKTVLEAMPFDDAPVEPRRAPVSAPAAPDPAAPRVSDFGSGDDLDIGEVSRVVNLADIARGAQNDRPAPRRAPTAPGVAMRVSGAQPSLRPSSRSMVPSASPPPDPEPGTTSAPVARTQRRGLIALLVVAGALVLGVVGAVLLLVTRDDDTPSTRLGTVQDIDTSRPDDPIARRPAGSASITTPTPPAPVPARPHPRPAPGTGQIAAAPSGGNGLGGDEIEDVARKHQDMTQRCYMRSQRGADSILVGDVKKIAVTLTVDRDGNVSELQLSDHAADNLGKCLSGAIRTWKFRPSAGGTFRFSLNFVDG